ncbi:portal protein [Roseomonas chloroacetimidivorans]|uniref:portal protein n=1 Tax=Roseomonas chloroacetimidivorans TaxID=1766656 RepID=UPI003C743CE4
MADKKKKLGDREIVSVLDHHLNRADKRGDTTLSKEREEALKLYNGELPAPPQKRSQYVSRDVADAVDSTKAVILNAVSRGQGTIEFTPMDDRDEEEPRIATAYCDHVLYRLNNGPRILHDTLHNGLLARNGIVKVWWEQDIQTEDYEVKGMEDAIGLMLTDQNENTLELPADATFLVDPETGEMSGIMQKKVDKGQIRVDVIPPEEFVISPDARCIEDATFVAHRSKRRIADLVSQGWDEDRLEAASKSNSLDSSPERVTRSLEGGGEGFQHDDEYHDRYGAGEVEVEECYIRINLDGTFTKRWQITKVGDYIYDKQVADTVHFVNFCPLPVSHSFYGSNYAVRLKDTQNAATTLTRSILDQTVISSYPRWMVTKGGVSNPSELTDLRFGGLVNVKDANSIGLLPQPQVNPYVMTTLELMKSNAESIGGVSRTAMGLNHDVVGKQNSGALLDQVTSASQQKMTQVAAWLARFLADLYLAIYDLALRYERKEVIVEVAGNFVPVTPEAWRERRHVTAEINLSPEAKMGEATKLANMVAMFSQDPVLGNMMGPEQKRYVAARYLRLMGLPSVDKVLLPVAKILQPQPDPNIQLQQQLLQAQMQANALQHQASIAKAQATFEAAQMQAQIKALKAAQDNAVANRKAEIAEAELELKSAEFDHDVEMDKANLELAKANGLVSAAVSLQSKN